MPLEHRHHRLVEPLAAVDDDQQSGFVWQTTLDQIGQEATADALVLGGRLSTRQRLLGVHYEADPQEPFLQGYPSSWTGSCRIVRWSWNGKRGSSTDPGDHHPPCGLRAHCHSAGSSGRRSSGLSLIAPGYTLDILSTGSFPSSSQRASMSGPITKPPQVRLDAVTTIQRIQPPSLRQRDTAAMKPLLGNGGVHPGECTSAFCTLELFFVGNSNLYIVIFFFFTSTYAMFQP